MTTQIKFWAARCLWTALLGVSATPVWADARATALLSNFGYSVVDLTPNDGITAGVSFVTERFATNTTAVSFERSPGPSGSPPTDLGNQVDDEWRGIDQFFATDSRSANLGSAQGSVSLAGDVQDGHFSAALKAHAASARSDGLYTTFAGTNAEPAWAHYRRGDERVMMVLEPNTALTLNGSLHLEVEKARLSPETRHERAAASAELSLWTPFSEQLAFWNASLDTKGLVPGLVSQDFDLNVTWINATPNIAQGQIFFGLNATATSSISPVPEPDTVGLLLAGLGVVAFTARCRARSTSRASNIKLTSSAASRARVFRAIPESVLR